MTYTTTVTTKGTITLPVKVRRSLNIKPGDRVSIDQKGSLITVKPDTYEKELADLRQNIEKELRAKGKWGVSFEEARQRATEVQLKEYEHTHGPRS